MLVENGSQGVMGRYLHGPGVDEPLALEKGGRIYYYQLDEMGSVRWLSNGIGIPVQYCAYDSFGEGDCYRVGFAAQVDQPYGYTGREWDRETGLYYYRARYYDPKVGRFLTRDPIGFLGGDVNLYRYVGNNPINNSDPSGLLAPPWHYFITYRAARNSGYGIFGSLSLAWKTTAVDFGESAEDPVRHGMAFPGQSRAEAIAATNDYIQRSRCNDVPGGIHAIQDLATPGHNGREWFGYKFNWETLKHILGDIFPSLGTINRAYQNTIRYLK